MDIDATALAWDFFQANAPPTSELTAAGDSEIWTFGEAETASGLRYHTASRGSGDGTLLLHLHGATQGWESLSSDVEALTAIIDRSQTTDRTLIAAPHDSSGWSMWTDSADGTNNIASLITKELIPDIEARFGAGGTADRRVLSGFSMGGFGAASLGLTDPSQWRAIAVWDGAMHTWDTLSKNRRPIAEGHFGGDLEFFDEWSPWSLAESQATGGNLPPFFVAHGSLPAFIEDYAAHLRGLGITVSEFDTNCGHALGCLTREAGDEFIRIAFD